MARLTTKEVDEIINEKFKETIASEVRQFVAMSGNMAIYANLSEKDIYTNKMQADLSEFKRI